MLDRSEMKAVLIGIKFDSDLSKTSEHFSNLEGQIARLDGLERAIRKKVNDMVVDREMYSMADEVDEPSPPLADRLRRCWMRLSQVADRLEHTISCIDL